MASHLLRKEEEFHKLNEKLQVHNNKLMQEFDTVMKKQDKLLIKTSAYETNVDYLNLSCRKQQSQFDESLNKSVYVAAHVKLFENTLNENNENTDLNNLKLVDIPHSVDQMGIKGMAHFYRAKIKAMQNEYDKLHSEFKNKCEECRKSCKESIKLTEEKEKWCRAYTTNKAEISKFELQLTALTTKCTTKDNEILSLKKELEQLKKNLKSTNSNISGSEVRLNRALEENEKMKLTIKTTKQEEKDLKEAHKKQIAELTELMRNMEKQKNELFTAFKKQMYLIDNLKKQKVYIEATKLTQLSERDFSRILDWKIE